MEHPCHRCGDPVPDSSPFCPECGAPQIRFDGSRPEAEGVVVPRTGADSLPAMPAQASGWQETNHRVAGRERTVVIRAALNGAIVAAILTTLKFGFILGMPLGGFLAVFFYRRRSWRAEPTPGAGFKVGAIAGLFASAIYGIMVAVMLTVSNQAAELHRQLIERFQAMESRYPDPQQRQVVEFLMTPQAMRVEMIVSAVLMAIIFVVLSGLGGMISASLLRRKGPRG